MVLSTPFFCFHSKFGVIHSKFAMNHGENGFQILWVVGHNGFHHGSRRKQKLHGEFAMDYTQFGMKSQLFFVV
jgi:hypothetical protein